MAGEMTTYSDIHWQPHKVDRAEKDSKSDVDILRLKKGETNLRGYEQQPLVVLRLRPN